MRTRHSSAWLHDEQPAPSPRRWLQFRFATLLWFVAFTAVLSLWYSERDKLTKRMQKLEDRLMLHAAAQGDEAWAVDMSNNYGYPGPPTDWGGGGTMPQYGSGAVVMSQPGVTVILSPPLGTTPPAATTVSDEWIRHHLGMLFTNHRAWLEKHCGQDTAWQEFGWKDPGVPLPPMPSATSTPPGAPGKVIVAPGTGGGLAPIYPVAAAPPTTGGGNPYPSAPPTPRPKRTPPAPLKLELYLPTVCKLLTQGETLGRAEAASCLAHIAVAAKDAVVPLAEAINDAEAGVRDSAAYALRTLDTNAQAAAPRLKELLASGRARDEILVARTLATIDPQSSAVTRLAELLQDKDANVRYSAAANLMALGRKKAAVAAPALEEALGDANQAVQIMAAQALSCVAPPEEAQAILTRAVKQEKNPQVRRVMARLVMRLANTAE